MGRNPLQTAPRRILAEGPSESEALNRSFPLVPGSLSFRARTASSQPLEQTIHPQAPEPGMGKTRDLTP